MPVAAADPFQVSGGPLPVQPDPWAHLAVAASEVLSYCEEGAASADWIAHRPPKLERNLTRGLGT